MKRYLPYLALVFFASVPLWLHDQYYLHTLVVAGIFMLAAMSLNLLLGYTGQLSLGHVAFFGIGAYVSALTSLGFSISLFGYQITHEPWPPVVGLVLGTVIAGLCGYLIGKLAFRVRGAYFVIVTVSFAEVVRLVALNWVELTNGPLALPGIPPLTLGFEWTGYATLWGKSQNYYLVLVFLVLAYLVIKRLVHSPFGRAMIALRENETLAVSVGISVTKYLVLAAVFSGALAGLAGSLYAHYIQIIDPMVFMFLNTVTMVIMVVTGGKGTLAGPVVGGLIFGIAPVILRNYVGPEVQWILYGLLMIAIVFVLPDGIVPAIERWFNRASSAAQKSEPSLALQTGKG
ncbi:branched-chain amino acid ABC transporter permease [Sinorhizobium meliloti]|uniref:branched-chain amino acid ABC transporter permease n=1 Tax=Rhizobium meliloti TaxID=382 RepID=UPI000B49AC6D|nr:branched-chain amino acid ABC transporter permease [Sinorhizobium meliloti]ASQ06299.1 branched-chain amino acid ABC transporter permease [Sinorhizobium meliloti]MDW9486280.1 branched-chain amino acid ABC transporter permease [Sinorhizobium meliloti]MDW9586620.1 branched-chain amino acid ABC transporter permease [Sinorhizobium meliloti]MDW9605171.1 branched-chain amino acid ABC transporter permease [Sinorhizobium meliloti]MDW9675270.1 branched-chain amino acid ABC transporter permease [Sinor